MAASLQAAIAAFIAHQDLPDDYEGMVTRWFLPLLEAIRGRAEKHEGSLVVGVSGCQGSGKSTLAALLVMLLREAAGLKGINLSLDDFYLTRSERQQLAAEVHPLLLSRGAPGTHDVHLAISTIEGLKRHGQIAVPRFDKALDDRLPQRDWPVLSAPAQVIILEGWCLGIAPQEPAALIDPINALELNEDAEAVWRNYVNDCIAQQYQPLYALIDYFILLQAPGFEKVYEWRQNQEDKLAAQCHGGTADKIMDAAQLKRFIQHYERLTRHGLRTLPAKADVVFELTDQQTIGRGIYREVPDELAKA